MSWSHFLVTHRFGFGGSLSVGGVSQCSLHSAADTFNPSPFVSDLGDSALRVVLVVSPTLAYSLCEIDGDVVSSLVGVVPPSPAFGISACGDIDDRPISSHLGGMVQSSLGGSDMISPSLVHRST